ncbi:tol-pal system protein YbgF [Prosthecochloris sp. GSB1]|uniref:tol-pal system protein YbgF n=1 Tax=Prosthecochloris sp. GSB1 TaxID=281093 RepID=UPI001EEE7160|nr:tol-pal system protein YbgF [Prosthecochloris sp. GSB1]
MYILQDDVKQLKSQTRQTGGESAEVYSEVQQLREEVSRLQGTIEELRNKLGTSGQTPETAAVPGSQTPSGTPGALETVSLPPDETVVRNDSVQAMSDPASPSTAFPAGSATDDQGLYNAGVGYFEKYDYATSRKEFSLLIDNYPSSPLADDAQYYIAETYYNEKWYEKAILEYQLVIEKYPKGDKRPAAYFKQGLAFENIGDSTNARVRYRELVQLYPASNEARIVKDKLQ